MSSDCIIGSAECEMNRIAQLLTKSVVKGKFRDCYYTIGVNLGIKKESLERIAHDLRSTYMEDVQILDKILLEYRSQNSEDTLLYPFIEALKETGCRDFADALTKEFLTKRNDLEPNNTETETSTSTERNTLLPPHALPSTLERIQPSSTKDIQLTEGNASLAVTNSENKVALSWCCISILAFVVFVVFLLLFLLVFYMPNWKTDNPFSENLRNFNRSTNSSYNHTISKSACGYNVQDIVVHNHEHYISKMNSYIQGHKTSIFIDIRKPIYWPHDAPILQPECVQSFSVKGPLNFAVINFLTKSQSLQNLRLSYPNISCDIIGLHSSSSNKTCIQLKNVKNFEMQDFSDCSSILNILSKSFMMPIISRLKIAQHNIKNEDLKILNKLVNPNTIECLEVVTPTLAYNSLHLKKYFPLYLKQLELKAEKSNQHAVLFKPKSTLSLKICNKFDMLEVLKIDGWFLPLNTIWNCSSIKVLHLSLTIMRHEIFNDVSIFLDFDYLKELDLHINYQSKENCPSSGLIGIDKLEHSLLKLSIKTDMCNIRNSSSNFSKSISRSTPEYKAVDNCREKDSKNVRD